MFLQPLLPGLPLELLPRFRPCRTLTGIHPGFILHTCPKYESRLRRSASTMSQSTSSRALMSSFFHLSIELTRQIRLESAISNTRFLDSSAALMVRASRGSAGKRDSASAWYSLTSVDVLIFPDSQSVSNEEDTHRGRPRVCQMRRIHTAVAPECVK
jgi:hypothetical protein